MRQGKVINLLNTTCSCTLRTGLTSGKSPLLLFQSAFFFLQKLDVTKGLVNWES